MNGDDLFANAGSDQRTLRCPASVLSPSNAHWREASLGRRRLSVHKLHVVRLALQPVSSCYGGRLVMDGSVFVRGNAVCPEHDGASSSTALGHTPVLVKPAHRPPVVAAPRGGDGAEVDTPGSVRPHASRLVPESCDRESPADITKARNTAAACTVLATWEELGRCLNEDVAGALGAKRISRRA